MKMTSIDKLSEKKKIEYEVLYKSLVGSKIEITNSKIKNQIGLVGIIVHESSNFFHLKLLKEQKIVRIFKNNVFFNITLEGKPLNIDGRLLFFTVLQRIKKIK